MPCSESMARTDDARWPRLFSTLRGSGGGESPNEGPDVVPDEVRLADARGARQHCTYVVHDDLGYLL